MQQSGQRKCPEGLSEWRKGAHYLFYQTLLDSFLWDNTFSTSLLLGRVRVTGLLITGKYLLDPDP
jgi:hypothetical protein